MSYTAIFEIGPIADYIKSTRKTKDLWGGSFLFSYLMGYAAKLILEEELDKQGFKRGDITSQINSIILRPALLDNPLFGRICDFGSVPPIDAGSIPDQFFCQLKKTDTPEKVKKKLINHLLSIFNNCLTALLDNYHVSYEPTNGIVQKQIDDYFRFFFVFSDQFDNQINFKNAASARGEIFEFDSYKDKTNTVSSKSEKCSLCGDRKRVITLIKARRNNRDEHLCAICTIKRGLLDYVEKRGWINLGGFQSTTAIAAQVPRNIMKRYFDELEYEIERFRNAHKGSDEANDDLGEKQINSLLEKPIVLEVIDTFSYQFYFADEDKALEFRGKVKEKANKDEKFWVDHPFYAIIALDGDDTGKIMEEFEKQGKLDEFSDAIRTYTQQTGDIISKYGGQLIFCGGEDTLAIVHPLNLLKLVDELNQSFKNSFTTALNRINNYKPALSISAGAIICHHKYPLSLAVEGAQYMLDDVAKGEAGKASLAVRLIKGGSGRCDFICKIADGSYNLSNFQELIGCGIPRGFVYKLIEEKEIIANTLKRRNDLAKYFLFLFEKTREKIDDEQKIIIKAALEKLASIYQEGSPNLEREIQKLIDYLYFARFLEGGE